MHTSGSNLVHFNIRTMADLFTTLDSRKIAAFIRDAKRFVSYAGPGLQDEPAKALCAVSEVLGPASIDVCVDFDERVMRMGFGSITALEMLRTAGITIRSSPGIRTGLVIADDLGYCFTPVAKYLEAEPTASHAFNAMTLSREGVAEVLARLSPSSNEQAVTSAESEEDRVRLTETIVEVRSKVVSEAAFAKVQERLSQAPPVNFDVARQVRVFEPYLQYVEMKLIGAAIQRHRVVIPPAIMKMGGGKEIEGRLKTTFDLIEKGGVLSSKALETEINEIRKDLTPSLGKTHGRVILKSKKDLLEKRIASFRKNLEAHQNKVSNELDKLIDSSKDQIITYYLPRVTQDPPDSMLGQLLTDKPTESDARKWLAKQLDRVLPKAENLVTKMELEIQYKDITFETLNRKDFIDALKLAFDQIDWDKAYEEFQAAGESEAGE